MERQYLTLIFTLVFLGSLFFLQKNMEGFGATSPGTMVQLQTSHVPTEEDLFMAMHEKKRAEAEARRMTSGFLDIHGSPY